MNYIVSLFIFIIATSCNNRNDSLHADISGVNAMAMQDLEQATFAGGASGVRKQCLSGLGE